MLLDQMTTDGGWREVLPPPAFALLHYLATPLGRTERNLHELMSSLIPAGLSATIWDQLPYYGDPDDPETAEHHAEEDREMAAARVALPRYASALDVGDVRTYRDLLRFAIAAGLVIHVSDGLLLNPAPPRPSEVLAYPSRVTRWHRQL